MSLTLANIRDLIRRQSDTDTDDITDADIDFFINLAKNKVDTHADWPYLEKSSAIAVTAGAATVALPSDFAWARDARWQNTGSNSSYPMVQIAPEERPVANDTTGTPTRFWTFGGVMSLWRPPANNGTFTLEYYKVPVELVNTGDVPEFDARFHRILVYGGLVEVYERIDFWEEARVVKSDFDEMLGRMDLFYLRARQPMIFGQRALMNLSDAHTPDIPFSFER